MAENFSLSIKHGPMKCWGENTSDVSDQRTDEIYFTHKLPWKFCCPGKIKEYRPTESMKVNLRFRSTSMDYGEYLPTVHTIPLVYFPLITSFSNEFTYCGPYRSYSLNTELDKTNTYVKRKKNNMHNN